EDECAGSVLEELVRQTELVHAGVDSRGTQVLADPRADPPDAHTILEGDDEAMVAGEFDDGVARRHDPARIDDGRPDSLVREPLGDLQPETGERADRDEEDVLMAGLSEHVD